ncbi:MAG: DUF1289 domain-containing protein [Labrys sp. (in: a-proteobacteria)]|jgi:predicted Fe-S protein YdhL (DUF1289 family)
MQQTSSPCVAICQIDPASGFCIGCGRTSQEIGRWILMSEPDRLALMARLPARFEESAALAEARAAHDARGRTGRRRLRQRFASEAEQA